MEGRMKFMSLIASALAVAVLSQGRVCAAESFNVKDFGAKGNGVADDAPAIQKAINAAAAKAGGGNVVFPKGTYQGDGNQCVHLVAHDTSFTGNTVIVKGSAMGVRGEGPPPQSLTIKNNTFRMGKGAGIMIASHGVDGSTVTGNTITGSGAHGIYVASPAQPNSGKHVIHGNSVTGYDAKLSIDPALHPDTVLPNCE